MVVTVMSTYHGVNKLNLFIQIQNSKPVNHPIEESNLRHFIPNLDINSPPEGFARFVRKPMPDLPSDMKLDCINYVYDNDLSKELNTPTYTDEYVFRKYTKEEREELIDEFKKLRPEQKDWIYDETTGMLIPPVPKPNDGKDYLWVYADDENGIPESKWVEYENIGSNHEELIELLRSLKDLQKEMNIPEEALDTVLRDITENSLKISSENNNL